MAVCGYGIAGKCRVRDALAFSKHFKFEGLISRRQHPDLQQTTWDQLAGLQSTSVPTKTVAICTENGNHFEAVRRGLEAGCGVLVDYPLCLSSHETDLLYSLADELKLKIFVEVRGN
jgi:predicted dehydrogenase